MKKLSTDCDDILWRGPGVVNGTGDQILVAIPHILRRVNDLGGGLCSLLKKISDFSFIYLLLLLLLLFFVVLSGLNTNALLLE